VRPLQPTRIFTAFAGGPFGAGSPSCSFATSAIARALGAIVLAPAAPPSSSLTEAAIAPAYAALILTAASPPSSSFAQAAIAAACSSILFTPSTAGSALLTSAAVLPSAAAIAATPAAPASSSATITTVAQAEASLDLSPFLASSITFGVAAITDVGFVTVYEANSGLNLKQAIVAALAEETALAALVGPNVFPKIIPETCSLANSAAITYKFLTSAHTTNLRQAAGMQSVRVRFGVYSFNEADTETIKEILRNLFQGFSTSLAGLPIVFVTLEDGDIDDYDEPIAGSDSGTYSKEFDFLFKLRESIPTNT